MQIYMLLDAQQCMQPDVQMPGDVVRRLSSRPSQLLHEQQVTCGHRWIIPSCSRALPPPPTHTHRSGLLPLRAPDGRDLWAPEKDPHEAHHRRRGQYRPAGRQHVHARPVHHWSAPRAVRLLVQAECQHRTCCKRLFCASEWRSVHARVGGTHG
jgi:hypothetical protein